MMLTYDFKLTFLCFLVLLRPFGVRIVYCSVFAILTKHYSITKALFLNGIFFLKMVINLEIIDQAVEVAIY